MKNKQTKEKLTGIKNPIDSLGRVTIPASIRKFARMKFKKLVEISIDENGNILLNVPKEGNVASTRMLDDLGRIVIPMPIKKSKGITTGDLIEFSIDDNNNVIVQKYTPGCIFCGNTEDLIDNRDKKVCISCTMDLFDQANKYK